MKDVKGILQTTVLPVLSPQIGWIISQVPLKILGQLTEIRIRINRPLLIMSGGMDYMLQSTGHTTIDSDKAYYCSQADIAKTVQLISQNSLYAFEQEIRMGYITTSGGHRVGLAGQAIVNDGRVQTLKNISSLNFRLAREVIGCSDTVIPYIVSGSSKVFSTLIISPPRCGKTTILRDIVRQVSSGIPSLEFYGVQVGVVDERAEIAACHSGVPTVDLGYRCDVLDGCPKAEGMLMLIRTMAPQVIVTDELGREDDCNAILEGLHAGVSVVATVHGRDLNDVIFRPYVGDLIKGKCFERYVILSGYPAVGTVDTIIAGNHNEVLYSRAKGVKVCG